MAACTCDYQVYSLIEKLKTAYDSGMATIVPKRQEQEILSYFDKHQKDEPWMQDMMTSGRLLFAWDVMELLELALEGKRHTLATTNKCHNEVYESCSPAVPVIFMLQVIGRVSLLLGGIC